MTTVQILESSHPIDAVIQVLGNDCNGDPGSHALEPRLPSRSIPGSPRMKELTRQTYRHLAPAPFWTCTPSTESCKQAMYVICGNGPRCRRPKTHGKPFTSLSSRTWTEKLKYRYCRNEHGHVTVPSRLSLRHPSSWSTRTAASPALASITIKKHCCIHRRYVHAQ
jgi:hypothetical protein